MDLIFQVPGKREWETLEVVEGNIICTCLHNLFNKQRETISFCRHAKELRENLERGNIEQYHIIKKYS